MTMVILSVWLIKRIIGLKYFKVMSSEYLVVSNV